MEFVLRTGGQALPPAETGQIEEILDYFRYTQNLMELAQSHPYVANFIGIAKVEDITAVEDGKHEAEKAIVTDAETMGTSVSGQKTPVTIKEEILSKDISLQEKIVLLNSFAGAYYYEHKNEAAKLLLLAAKDIDRQNEESIRNLVMLALEENDKSLALEYVADLGMTDFSLIKMIRDH